MLNHYYTERQWGEEMHLNKHCEQHPNLFHNGCNLECPFCHEAGFYGPRQLVNNEKVTRKYRACKWCGIFQEAWGPDFDNRGGEPYQCVVVLHKKCGADGAWNAADANKWCLSCNDNMDVLFPKNDPQHQKIKAQMDEIHKNLNFPRIYVE